jgi:p-aminobenzoyl-glutamate transporter AbgT
MNWIQWVFLFAVYAIIVKIVVWIYEKLTKNKNRSKDSFDLKTHNELNEKSFSIVVENNYTLQAELTSKIVILLFFAFGISISLSIEMDSLDELSRRMALWTAIFGFMFTLLTRNKMLLTLIKNNYLFHFNPTKTKSSF